MPIIAFRTRGSYGEKLFIEADCPAVVAICAVVLREVIPNGQKHAAGMVAPFSSLEIAPKGAALRTLPAKFSFTTINDYGAVVNHNYPQ